MRVSTRVVVAGAAVATLLGAIGGSGTAGAPAPAGARLAGRSPAWARPAAAHGAAAGTDRVGFRVYLGWRGGDAAARLATAVATPGSSQYRRFLTPAQFRQQFAPSQ